MKMKKLQSLMKQAEQMQSQMASTVEKMRFEGRSGGAVKVVMNGSKQLLEVKISRYALDPDDAELLEEMILGAVNDAGEQVDSHLSDKLGGLAGGLDNLLA